MITAFLALFGGLVLPMLLVVLVGVCARRVMGLDISSLAALNLYFLVPAYLFTRLSQSELGWGEIARIGVAVVLPMAILGSTLGLGLRMLRVAAPLATVMIASSLFFNSGNFGVPLAEMAFGEKGGQVQAFVVTFTSMSTFFFGYWILAGGHAPRNRGAWRHFFRLPYLYVVAAALLCRGISIELPSGLTRGLEMLASGMVPIALITLGAQLGARTRRPRWSILVPVVLLKLVGLPLITWGVVRGTGGWPWPGEALVIATAAPTAVNTLLITLDVGGDAELAADCVFWSTLASSLSVAVWLTCFRNA